MRGPGRVTFLGGAAGGYTQCARVYHSVAQSIPNSVDTILAFDSERFDTDGIHDTVTNNSRLTCKTAGIYIVVASACFAASATGLRVVTLLLNGTTPIGIQTTNALVTGRTRLVAVSPPQDLIVGDYVEARVYHTSGGTLTVDVDAQSSPEFGMVRVA